MQAYHVLIIFEPWPNRQTINSMTIIIIVYCALYTFAKKSSPITWHWEWIQFHDMSSGDPICVRMFAAFFDTSFPDSSSSTTVSVHWSLGLKSSWLCSAFDMEYPKWRQIFACPALTICFDKTRMLSRALHYLLTWIVWERALVVCCRVSERFACKP